MRPLVLGHDPPDDRQVALADAAVLKIHLEGPFGIARPSAKEQAARLAIEAVRDLRGTLAVALT